ncbi:MAG: peptidoglycan DD-metalloendopeptidase family protein [Betaproteobacteria bacterium]|nr:peptidoglycan DD-metalloendopeptidase family protein [Betaproteobacteria bacterium]
MAVAALVAGTRRRARAAAVARRLRVAHPGTRGRTPRTAATGDGRSRSSSTAGGRAATRAGLAAADLHGEARRHAACDRARPRSRLPRTRRLEQPRECEPDSRRPGAAPDGARRRRAVGYRARFGGGHGAPAFGAAGAARRCAAGAFAVGAAAGDARTPQRRQLQVVAQGNQGALFGAGAARAAAPPPVPPPAVAAPEPVAAAPRVEPKPAPAAAPEPRPAAATTTDEGTIDWVWPSSGKVVTGFSDTANLKGIDIAGKAGQPVIASAAGKVVYAGTGLRGYGKLVIVKHNATFLSAYAHNREILVKEGQQVTKGQKIAEMGNTDTDQVKLHFEIRQRGKPVDPLRFLPPA